jgi:hypothetical protein
VRERERERRWVNTYNLRHLQTMRQTDMPKVELENIFEASFLPISDLLIQ